MDYGSSFFAALRDGAFTEWSSYVEHDFVQQLGRGTLPEAAFRHYLIQDYLFLIDYSRAYALAVCKSERLEDLRYAATMVDVLLNTELALHIEFSRQWGLCEEDLMGLERADANRLYTNYVMEEGQRGDLLDLLVALAPCAIGYGEIGKRLAESPDTVLEGNLYRPWIEMYAGDAFQEAAKAAALHMQEVAFHRGFDPENWTASRRWPDLVKIFATASRYEAGFWQMGLNVGKI